jgi:hypothetical protein
MLVIKNFNEKRRGKFLIFCRLKLLKMRFWVATNVLFNSKWADSAIGKKGNRFISLYSSDIDRPTRGDDRSSTLPRGLCTRGCVYFVSIRLQFSKRERFSLQHRGGELKDMRISCGQSMNAGGMSAGLPSHRRHDRLREQPLHPAGANALDGFREDRRNNNITFILFLQF